MEPTRRLPRSNSRYNYNTRRLYSIKEVDEEEEKKNQYLSDFENSAKERNYEKLKFVFDKIKKLIKSEYKEIKDKIIKKLTKNDREYILEKEKFEEVKDELKEKLLPVLHDFYRDLIPDHKPTNPSAAYNLLYTDPENETNFALYKTLKDQGKLGGKTKRNKRKARKTSKKRKPMFSWF